MSIEITLLLCNNHVWSQVGQVSAVSDHMQFEMNQTSSHIRTQDFQVQLFYSKMFRFLSLKLDFERSIKPADLPQTDGVFRSKWSNKNNVAFMCSADCHTVGTTWRR